jgi:hypothetical protein
MSDDADRQRRFERELREMKPASVALLWRLCMFCANWQGKVIEYTSRGYTTGKLLTEKGLVRGHDGPQWHPSRGWYLPNALEGSAVFGWGAVMILHTPGQQHHIDPVLIESVKEITRLEPAHSEYEVEAVDLYCPYECDADGLTDWDENWSGPEYEVFCPVHNRAAYERGQELYHQGFDGSRPDLELEYYDLTKVAYKKERASA